MLFSNRKNIMNEAIDLKIDESIINRVRECKFLGTVIDENLTLEATHQFDNKQNIKKNWNHV